METSRLTGRGRVGRGRGRCGRGVRIGRDSGRALCGGRGRGLDNALGTDDDAADAERHLTVALRIAPRDEHIAKRYREVSAVVAERARKKR